LLHLRLCFDRNQPVFASHGILQQLQEVVTCLVRKSIRD
jgi:hypothetical protein